MTTYYLEYAVPGFCLSNSLNYANKFLFRPGPLRFKSEQFTVAFYNKKKSIHTSFVYCHRGAVAMATQCVPRGRLENFIRNRGFSRV